jgi:hypothetical protein
MLKKIFFCIPLFYMFSVCLACSRTISINLIPAEEDSLSVSNNDEYLYSEEEEEIGNFDFLYYGGATFDYDQIQVASLMEEAMSHIGARYRFGSKGPYTFDCSGFTSYVYKQLGSGNIGASSRDQFARNTPIKRNELQPGDLVFFTSPRSSRGVGHVGIVVSVNTNDNTFEFIHASTNDGVKISKSTDGYYARRYVGARRVQ